MAGQGPMGSEAVHRMKVMVGAGKEGEKGRVWVKGRPGVHAGDFCLNPKTNRKLPEGGSRFAVC